MMYDIQGSIALDPIWWKDPPLVTVRLDDRVIYHDHMKFSKVISLVDRLECGDHALIVDFSNKGDQDTDIVRNLDKAVVIKSIDFFGITDPRFIWNGQYRPVYPAQWAQEQHQKGIPLSTVLKPHTYLGWNGTWKLDFSVPVFTWIHQTQSLGWIYD